MAYVFSLLLAFPGVGLGTAALVAFLPAIFAGPWMGSTILLARRCSQLSPSAPLMTVPTKIGPVVVPELAA